MHVPLYVVGVEVTSENMAEVAKWCEGTMSEVNGIPYIKVATIRPLRVRQTQAFVGDHVLKTQVGLKCYTPKAFARAFVQAQEDQSDPKAVELLERIFMKQP